MAACIYSNKNAVQTQSYGPESRGGGCKSEVIIADEAIDFPKVDDPDIVITMSQEAYYKYASNARKGATILVDPNMVTDRNSPSNTKIYNVPATQFAEELGKRIIANVVMLGALTAITNIVTPEAMKKAEEMAQQMAKAHDKTVAEVNRLAGKTEEALRLANAAMEKAMENANRLLTHWESVIIIIGIVGAAAMIGLGLALLMKP